MEKIDKIEYDKLFPENLEFITWVKSREKTKILLTQIEFLDRVDTKEVFNPFNTINS